MCSGCGVALPAAATALVLQLLQIVAATAALRFAELLTLTANRFLLLRLRFAPSCVFAKLPRTARIAVQIALTERIGLRAIFITAASKFTV